MWLTGRLRLTDTHGGGSRAIAVLAGALNNRRMGLNGSNLLNNRLFVMVYPELPSCDSILRMSFLSANV